MGQTIEHFFVQTLVSEFSVEALDEAVLHGLARCDIMPGYPAFILHVSLGRWTNVPCSSRLAMKQAAPTDCPRSNAAINAAIQSSARRFPNGQAGVPILKLFVWL